MTALFFIPSQSHSLLSRPMRLLCAPTFRRGAIHFPGASCPNADIRYHEALETSFPGRELLEYLTKLLR